MHPYVEGLLDNTLKECLLGFYSDESQRPDTDAFLLALKNNKSLHTLEITLNLSDEFFKSLLYILAEHPLDTLVLSVCPKLCMFADHFNHYLMLTQRLRVLNLTCTGVDSGDMEAIRPGLKINTSIKILVFNRIYLPTSSTPLLGVVCKDECIAALKRREPVPTSPILIDDDDTPPVPPKRSSIPSALEYLKRSRFQ
jgi:hypothetical protein